jgi:hypothetical protein
MADDEGRSNKGQDGDLGKPDGCPSYRNRAMTKRRHGEAQEAIRRAFHFGFIRLRRHDVERGGIIGLEKPEYDALIQKGDLTGDIFKKDQYNDEPLIEGLHFTCWADAQEEDDLIDWEPPTTIKPFLRHAHLCSYRESPFPELKLIVKESIYDILLEALENFDRRAMPFLSDIETQKPPLDLSRSFKDRLLGINSVCGRIATCDWPGCGDPFCSSELAWVENGICLVYLSASGAGIGSVFLFPFTTL